MGILTKLLFGMFGVGSVGRASGRRSAGEIWQLDWPTILGFPDFEQQGGRGAKPVIFDDPTGDDGTADYEQVQESSKSPDAGGELVYTLGREKPDAGDLTGSGKTQPASPAHAAAKPEAPPEFLSGLSPMGRYVVMAEVLKPPGGRRGF